MSRDLPSYRQLMIGLPGTGKTTFLAALWYVVESEEISGSLRLAYLDGNTEYLNKIRENWLKCIPVGRTISMTEEYILKLQTSEPVQTIELIFPDMTGETFSQQWENRCWTKEYDELLRSSTGILLFINPNSVKEAKQINSIALPNDMTCSEEIDLETNKPKPWSITNAPTQVQLVELLQFIAHDPTIYKINKLVVIISAWDTINNEIAPDEWLKQRLPLLDQYLKSHEVRLPYRIYGVSAQGGDFNSEADNLRLEIRQADRIIIVGNNCSKHDITAPIKWIIE